MAFLNLAGNVIGFLPFGFFLPILSRRLRNGAVVTALGFGLSLLVESIQLVFKVGCFDVDDLILNTLGVLLEMCIRDRRICKDGPVFLSTEVEI